MSPEFLRRYYVLRIISNPKTYGINYNGFVPIGDLQKALEDKRNENSDNLLFDKLTSHSSKTIKRDLNAIQSYFGIEILLKRNYGYYIESFEQTIDLREIYDKTELFLLNNKSSEWKEFITTERTSLNGSIDLSGLINAIDQKTSIYLEFNGWYDNNLFQNFKGYIQPLHLKEINKDWYLIAHNPKIGIYSFSLDNRIIELKITTKKVESPIVFSEKEYFKNSIGILNDITKPETIVLKVVNHHFKYLMSKPIHHSQKVINYPLLPETESLDYNDENIWGTIEVFVQPNYEFMMEILKYNVWVKVIKPQSFVNYIVRHLNQVSSYYV